MFPQPQRIRYNQHKRYRYGGKARRYNGALPGRVDTTFIELVRHKKGRAVRADGRYQGVKGALSGSMEHFSHNLLHQSAEKLNHAVIHQRHKPNAVNNRHKGNGTD